MQGYILLQGIESHGVRFTLRKCYLAETTPQEKIGHKLHDCDHVESSDAIVCSTAPWLFNISSGAHHRTHHF